MDNLPRSQRAGPIPQTALSRHQQPHSRDPIAFPKNKGSACRTPEEQGLLVLAHPPPPGGEEKVGTFESYTYNGPHPSEPRGSGTPRLLPTIDILAGEISKLCLRIDSGTCKTALSDEQLRPNSLHSGNADNSTRASAATSFNGFTSARSGSTKRTATGGDAGAQDDDDGLNPRDGDSNDAGRSKGVKSLPAVNEAGFECPYRKRNPIRFNCYAMPKCAKPFSDFSKLKKHLKDCHARAGGQSSQDPEDGLDADSLDDLTKRSASDKIGTWDKLWSTLFPGDQRIPSPHFVPCIDVYRNHIEALKSRFIDNEHQRKREMIEAGVEWTQGMEDLMQRHLSGIEEEFNTQLGLLDSPSQEPSNHQHHHAQQQRPHHSSHAELQSPAQAQSRPKYPPLAPKVDVPFQDPQSIPMQPEQQYRIYAPQNLGYDAATSTHQVLAYSAPFNQDISHLAGSAPASRLTGLDDSSHILTAFQQPSSSLYFNVNNIGLNHSAAYHDPRNSLQGHGDAMRNYVEPFRGRGQNQPPFPNWQEHGYHHNPSAEEDDRDEV